MESRSLLPLLFLSLKHHGPEEESTANNATEKTQWGLCSPPRGTYTVETLSRTAFRCLPVGNSNVDQTSFNPIVFDRRPIQRRIQRLRPYRVQNICLRDRSIRYIYFFPLVADEGNDFFSSWPSSSSHLVLSDVHLYRHGVPQIEASKWWC